VIARVLLRRGHNAHASGSCETALPLYERCLELARTIEDELYIGYALGHLANVYFTLRDIPRSLSYGRAACEIFQRRNDGAKESNALANLAECHFVLGDLGQAKATAHAAIAKALESESMINAVYAVQHLAAIAAAEGNSQPAARLLGYVEAALNRLGSKREYGNTYTRDRALETLRQQIAPAEMQQLEWDGAALSDGEAFALAAHLEAPGRDALEPI
jgi:tetratricopeptide (TPR) repeat protein